MTQGERIESKKLMDTLPIDIVSYYRNPTDGKKRLILFGATRLKRLEGSDWYKICVDQICIRILYACDHAFVDSIEHELLTVKI